MSKTADTKPVMQPKESKGFKLFAVIGRFSVRFRWLVILVWLIGAMVIIHSLPSLSSVTQSDNTNFLPASSPTEKALKIESAFQASNVVSVPTVVATSDTSLNSSDQQAITRLQSKLTAVNGVKQVVNRGNSADDQAEILDVQITEKFSSSYDIIDNLRNAISAANLPSDLQAHLTGDLAIAADNSKNSGKQNSDLQIGTVIFIIVLLVLIFRAPLAPLITLMPPLLVVAASGPIIAEAAKHGLKVSSLAQLLLTVLVLGAGTDYGLFLIFRVREEIETGLGSKEAIIKALSRVGESITFSAATVVAALLSLLVASFEIYSSLGIPLAIAIALMLLAGLTLLPALLAVFGRAVFWPTKPHKHTAKKIGVWGKLSTRIVQRPITVLVIGVIFFSALASFVPSYKSAGFASGSTAPSGTDSAEGQALLNKHFPSNSASPTEVSFVLPKSVWRDPSQLVKLSSLMGKSKSFNHVTGPLNPNGVSLNYQELESLHTALGSPWNLPDTQPASLNKVPQLAYELYRSTTTYISPNGKTVQFVVGLAAGSSGTTKAMNATPAIRAEVSQIARESKVSNSAVIGMSSAYYDISSISNHDLIRVVPIAVLVIGLLLAILMRSLIAPIYLVLSVVLSYLASLGISVLIFMKLGDNNGLVFILPFLMFIFLLALGEDYNILVMTRIREEAHHLPLKKAVSEALSTTSTTVTSAGLVLAGTFGVLGVISTGASNQEIREVGYGLAIGILMDTFLVRTLIVPSVVALLGKWNWWPSKHGSWVDQDS